MGLNCKKDELATERRTRISRSICHGITRKRHGRKQKQRHGRKKKQKHLPRINTEFHGKDRSKDTEGSKSSRSICHGMTRKRHGRKMRRQKKNWTSAYAKVTKARGKGDQGAEGQTSPIPSFHAKAGNPEIQAAKERQIKREASFLDLFSFAIFASSR